MAATLPLLLSCSNRAPDPLTFPHAGSVEQANETSRLVGFVPFSHQPGAIASVAQWDEQIPFKDQDVGSRPTGGITHHDLLLHPPSELQPPSDVLGVSLGTDVYPARGTGEPESNPEIAIPDEAQLTTATVRILRTVEPSGNPGQLSEGQIRQLLAEIGTPPEWIDALVAIAWAESRWSSGAIGDGGNSLGLFQLWTGWFRADEDPFDPATNARVSIRVRQALGRFGGAGGWSVAAGLGLY